MTRLVSYPRENFISTVPSTFIRRPLAHLDSVVAMHWDGTYRDRNACSAGFWSDIDHAWFGSPASPEKFAKHLA